MLLMFQRFTTEKKRLRIALTSHVHMVPILVQSKLRKRIKVMVFWDVMPCSLVDRYQHYGATCCLHLQERRWGHHVLPNSGTYLPKQQHHIPRPQIFILIHMRTSNHIQKIRVCCCGGLGWNNIHTSSIRNRNGSKII
jgi:hypothetical protein